MHRVIALALVGASSSGCYTYPCDQDVLACEEGDALSIADDCEASDGLTLRLLEVDEDAWPVVHHGVQGGVHFTLGMNIAGLDPKHVEVQLDVVARECQGDTCTTMATLAERTLVADDRILEPSPEGHALGDVVVLLEREPTTGGELVVDAIDACGRTTTLVHEVAP